MSQNSKKIFDSFNSKTDIEKLISEKVIKEKANSSKPDLQKED